jgi:hypothetical protein
MARSYTTPKTVKRGSKKSGPKKVKQKKRK